ncbi:leucyl/phenylalanyl-tRNA--protein transferase [Psychrobium sp. nBUS_13]|uniref:leucyl/phenylalanyl-tRNA--protein transferase n=1 Tax=Psychrobium sp. nBUS_13 TaxID=3395319 RepID=UPI003EBD5693
MSQLTLLKMDNIDFPPVELAMNEPDGLLAIGGDLSEERLLNAYFHGIFPWFNEDDPIMWWSPSKRCVIDCNEFHVSKSFRKFLRQSTIRITINKQFNNVINYCRQPRKDELGTWIDDKMANAYSNLHYQGHAHSIEAWQNDQLIGGLYGIFINNTFCGESMFSLAPNGSKVALLGLSQFLKQHNVSMIDCQIENPHLMSLGAKLISRHAFVEHLSNTLPSKIDWQSQEITIV